MEATLARKMNLLLRGSAFGRRIRILKLALAAQIGSLLILALEKLSAAEFSYSYSGAINGWTEVALSPFGHGSGGFIASFNTLTETVFYDPASQTIREVGSVSISGSSGSFIINSSAFYGGGTGAATLTVGDNGRFTFDRTASVRATDGFFSGDLTIPITGSGIYEGQAFAGAWSLDIPLVGQIIGFDESSITLTEHHVLGGDLSVQPGTWVLPGTDLKDAVDDGTYYGAWDPGTFQALATPVPETLPSSAGLLIGVGTILMRDRKKAAKRLA